MAAAWQLVSLSLPFLHLNAPLKVEVECLTNLKTAVEKKGPDRPTQAYLCVLHNQRHFWHRGQKRVFVVSPPLALALNALG